MSRETVTEEKQYDWQCDRVRDMGRRYFFVGYVENWENKETNNK